MQADGVKWMGVIYETWSKQKPNPLCENAEKVFGLKRI